MACFQGDGKSPPVSDRLSMCVMNGATVAAYSLRSHVGREESEGQCFQGDILMARMTSSTLAVVKIARMVVAKPATTTQELSGISEILSQTILPKSSPVQSSALSS